MTDEIIDTRLANALFPEARMADGLAAVPIVAQAIEQSARTFGGLWVGGRVTLTRGALHFAPNAMNVAAHRGGEALRLDVPLNAIRAADDKGGFITGIIEIRTDGGAAFRIRCWGAKGFSAKIRAAAGL